MITRKRRDILARSIAIIGNAGGAGSTEYRRV
jgi:hypothetical protein